MHIILYSCHDLLFVIITTFPLSMLRAFHSLNFQLFYHDILLILRLRWLNLCGLKICAIDELANALTTRKLFEASVAMIDRFIPIALIFFPEVQLE